MAESGNGLLRLKDLSARCALLTLGKSCLGAGGCDGRKDLLIVPLGGQDLLVQLFAAVIANAVAISVCRAGRILLRDKALRGMRAMRGEDRLCRNVDGGGCGDRIDHTVAIQIKALKDVLIDAIGIILDIGYANDLRGAEDSASCKGTVCAIEVCVYPIVTVDNAVSGIPAREVLVPHRVLLGLLNKDRHAGDGVIIPIVEGGVKHFHPFGEDDVLERHRKIGSRPAKKVYNSVRLPCEIRHIRDDQGLEVGE